MRPRPPIYGLMAEFSDVGELVHATRTAHESGYRYMDAYTPVPVEELGELLAGHRSRLPLLVLLGGILGGIGGFALCYWTSVIDFPINVGGRPFNSWPSFIPITFECTVLGAALVTVFGLLALNGLPMPYHPVFNVPRFARASRDRFFLCIEAKDPRFDLGHTGEMLRSLGAAEVSEVPP